MHDASSALMMGICSPDCMMVNLRCQTFCTLHVCGTEPRASERLLRGTTSTMMWLWWCCDACRLHHDNDAAATTTAAHGIDRFITAPLIFLFNSVINPCNQETNARDLFPCGKRQSRRQHQSQGGTDQVSRHSTTASCRWWGQSVRNRLHSL